jgi:hypothetical protein
MMVDDDGAPRFKIELEHRKTCVEADWEMCRAMTNITNKDVKGRMEVGLCQKR